MPLLPGPERPTAPATDAVTPDAPSADVPGPDAAAPDRRAALRARHRRAIVAAAATLMEEKGGARFTVDELAARADVARRTIFNHFASLDDVVVEVCEDVLGSVVETLGASAAEPGTDRPTPLDDVTAALRGTDLVGPVSYTDLTLPTILHV